MAPVRPIKCERCGRVVPDKWYYVRMRVGIYAMVCADCKNTIESIFRVGCRAGLPDPEKLFPALMERVGTTHG